MIGRLQLTTERMREEENEGIVQLRILRTQVCNVKIECLNFEGVGCFFFKIIKSFFFVIKENVGTQTFCNRKATSFSWNLKIILIEFSYLLVRCLCDLMVYGRFCWLGQTLVLGYASLTVCQRGYMYIISDRLQF